MCHCGGNIADVIDLDKIEEELSHNPDIVSINHHENLCSQDASKLIESDVLNHDLDRVVVCACSSLTHGETFRNYIKPLNPYLFEMPNVREQCSWVTEDPDKATKKAYNLINSAVESVKHDRPLEKFSTKVKKDILVVGAGIAGMTAANALARQDIDVTLIDKAASVGGAMAKVSKVFSPEKLTEDCAACLLNPVINDTMQCKNIKIYNNTEMIKSSRRAGNFDVVLKKKPEYVDTDRCISCGKCAEVCNIVVPDEWNEGLLERKAIYKPFPQAVPSTYTLDDEVCVKCGRCERACPLDAINLDATDEIISHKFGAIVIATGHKDFDTSKRPEYGHELYQDVITQMELARLIGVNGPTDGELIVPSTGKTPKSVFMIQCVGSRDQLPGGNKYCSKVCCMVALKNANLIRTHFPDCEVTICYTDIRSLGVYEKYYKHVQDNGLKLIRGRPGEVTRKNGKMLVRVEDTLKGEYEEIETDLVVLSTAMEASEGTVKTAQQLSVPLTDDDFIKEKHPKMQPVTTDIEGVFVCGTAQGPKDITDSIIQANAAASKISELVNGGLVVDPHIASINFRKCKVCGTCKDVCIYQAITIDYDTVRIDPVLCTGCGVCIVHCPEEALSIRNQTDDKLTAAIDGLLEHKEDDENIIIAFLDEVGTVSANNMGINKIACPPSVHIINVPFINRVKYKHVKHALTSGASGVFLGEYPDSPSHEEVRANIADMKKQLEEEGIDPNRLMVHSVFVPYFRGLRNQFAEFDEYLKTKE